MDLLSKIPSPNSLFVFATVAKNKNFTAAARQLNVSQPAISTAIAKLEKHLNKKLFIRGPRELSFTDEGELLYQSVHKSFSSISDAIDIVKTDQNQISISLSIPTAMASHWLIPRLDNFYREFPNTALNLNLVEGLPTGSVAPSDLGLRFGARYESDFDRKPFAPERVFALASPEYIHKHGYLDKGKKKTTHTIIEFSNPKLRWDEFASQTGLSLPTKNKTIIASDYSVVLQSALLGQGIALGYVSTASRLMREKLLIPISSCFLDTGRRFHLVIATKETRKPLINQVRSWMIKQMQFDLAQLDKLLV